MAKSMVLILAAAVIVTCSGPRSEASTLAYDAYLRTTLRRVEVPQEPDAGVRHTQEVVVKPKSPLGAMLLSALVPGLGEVYVGGRRGYITGSVLIGIDALSIYKIYDLNKQGDDARDIYRAYADRWYDVDRFEAYVWDTIAVANKDLSEVCDYDDGKNPSYDPGECRRLLNLYFPLSGGDDFYEQIDVEDRFAFGWKDWEHDGAYVPIWNGQEPWNWTPDAAIPADVFTDTPHRLQYRTLRDEANNLYSSADKYAWIMVIGRVVSMVDAVILARVHNSQIASLASRMNLSFQVKSITKPDVRLGVKMRF